MSILIFPTGDRDLWDPGPAFEIKWRSSFTSAILANRSLRQSRLLLDGYDRVLAGSAIWIDCCRADDAGSCMAGGGGALTGLLLTGLDEEKESKEEGGKIRSKLGEVGE